MWSEEWRGWWSGWCEGGVVWWVREYGKGMFWHYIPLTQLKGEASSERYERLKRSPPQRQRKYDLDKLGEGGMNGKRVSTKWN
jgi:hypothetical protein